MRAEDFSAWLSRIAGLSAQQRREALQALAGVSGEERNPATGDSAQGPAKESGKRRGRGKDALGTTSHKRVEAQGCPHCAGREVIGWGRSHGLLRFRCKSCGRTFGGFKWSSQHLDGSCDEHSKTALGSFWAGALVLTRSTAGGRARGAAAILGSDCGGHGE
jgi:hypothetical protein